MRPTATASRRGDGPRLVPLLLSLQDTDALRLFCDSLLGPIEHGEGAYGGELVRSLEAFIEANGQWESAARTLYCHRHTLRYRIRKIEELTGRDLGSARDRIEFWLALRGRELVLTVSGRMRVAVIGAAGIMGSVVARDLATRTASVVALDRAHGDGDQTPSTRAIPRPCCSRIEGCDVVVNAASYRVNLDGDGRCGRRARHLRRPRRALPRRRPAVRTQRRARGAGRARRPRLWCGARQDERDGGARGARGSGACSAIRCASAGADEAGPSLPYARETLLDELREAAVGAQGRRSRRRSRR